jgi:hypothetical protein
MIMTLSCIKYLILILEKMETKRTENIYEQKKT